MTSTARLAPPVDYDRSLHWSHLAACAAGKPVDPDWWHSVGHAVRLARHICLGHCPVRMQCDRDAPRPSGGVVGGWLHDSASPPRRSPVQPSPLRVGCPLCEVACGKP